MADHDPMANLQIPVQIWVEVHSDDVDARDVLVRMEDGNVYTSLFVTPDYIKRQMELTFELSKQIEDTIPRRFCTLDVPHIVVESLERDVIEDALDNLLAMEVFEGVFTQVTDPPQDTTTPTTTSTTNGGTRATQEVAAVVLSDVLVVES